MNFKFKNYTVNLSVAVCPKGTFDIVDEFDSKLEARKKYPKKFYDLWWLAAEEINEDGDLNPAVWGETRFDAIQKIKRVLS